MALGGVTHLRPLSASHLLGSNPPNTLPQRSEKKQALAGFFCGDQPACVDVDVGDKMVAFRVTCCIKKREHVTPADNLQVLTDKSCMGSLQRKARA